jgi:hypothetical protein
VTQVDTTPPIGADEGATGHRSGATNILRTAALRACAMGGPDVAYVGGAARLRFCVNTR